MHQLQHMCAYFGSHLDHISNEMCQTNTRIGRIARRQSRFDSFAHFPFPEPAKESSDSGDDESDDAFRSPSDVEMTISR